MKHMIEMQLLAIERAIGKMRAGMNDPTSIRQPISARVQRARQLANELLAMEGEEDPWSDLVIPWAATPRERWPQAGGLRSKGIAAGWTAQRCYLSEVLAHALGFKPGQADHADKVRVSTILRKARWRKRRESPHKLGGKRLEYWIPPIG